MWMAVVTGVFLQTGPLGDPLPDRRFPPASWAAEQAHVADQLRFNEIFGRAWRNSNLSELRAGTLLATTDRGKLLHCHVGAGGPMPPRSPLLPPAEGPVDSMHAGMRERAVRSAYHTHRYCPFWNSEFRGASRDEHRSPDRSLMPSMREGIRAIRDSLLRQLDSAVRRYPESRFFHGQRLRLALDQEDPARARAAADACRGDAWWCSVLRGHERNRAGDVPGAATAFAEAARLGGDRCAIFDVSLLPNDADRRTRDQRPCAASAGLLDTLWWLSRPFLDDPSPARAVEHYSRGVNALLHRALPRTERYWMLDSAGGDAIHDILIRYGPPQLHTALGDVRVNALHSGWLIQGGLQGPRTEPYPTLEYARGMVSLVPNWSAIRSPFTAKANDWRVSPPRDEFDQEDQYWFPQELWIPPTPMVQLDLGQFAQLRRDATVHIAAALPFVSTGIGRPIGEVVRGVRVVSSRRPTHAERITTFNATVGRTLVARADIAPVPMVVGVEYDAGGRSAGPAGRARWGVMPIRPLSALRPGEYAISDPVIVAPDQGRDVLNGDPDAALPRMLPRMTFSPSEDIGVYWETYGLAPGDTVDVAIWIERTNAQSTLRQLGVTLRVAQDLNTPVAISWTEPQPSRSAVRVPGTVPIMARVITLDLSTLIEGTYALDVAVARPGQPAVRGRTQIEIRR